MLSVVAILYSLPLLTRADVFFSATVQPGFPRSQHGQRLLRSFRLQLAMWTVLAIAVLLLSVSHSPGLAGLLPVLVLLAGTGFSYWRKFREVHNCYGVRKPEIREANISPVPTSPGFRRWVIVPPFLLLAAMAVFLSLHWDRIPRRFPVHWGVDRQPDRWASRDWRGVFRPLLYGAYLNIFMLALGWVLAHESRRTVMRDVTVRFLQFICYPLSFTFAAIALLPFLSDQ